MILRILCQGMAIIFLAGLWQPVMAASKDSKDIKKERQALRRMQQQLNEIQQQKLAVDQEKLALEE